MFLVASVRVVGHLRHRHEPHHHHHVFQQRSLQLLLLTHLRQLVLRSQGNLDCLVRWQLLPSVLESALLWYIVLCFIDFHSDFLMFHV